MLNLPNINVSILIQQNFHQPIFPTEKKIPIAYKQYRERYDYALTEMIFTLIFNIH